MKKRRRGVELDKALDRLLRKWQSEPPSERQINVKAVAESLSVSRTSLYKDSDASLEYPKHLRSRAARIEAAARRQRENADLSPRATVDKIWHDRLRKVQDERDEWKARCEELQLRIAGMEYHANLNGWDASELWKPLPPNDRGDRGRAVPASRRFEQRRRGA